MIIKVNGVRYEVVEGDPYTSDKLVVVLVGQDPGEELHHISLTKMDDRGWVFGKDISEIDVEPDRSKPKRLLRLRNDYIPLSVNLLVEDMEAESRVKGRDQEGVERIFFYVPRAGGWVEDKSVLYTNV